MFKLVMLLRKRPDITREQFIDHYDNRHVPLMHSLQAKGAAVHRRNFVVPPEAGSRPEYDAIVEIFYEDLATAQGAASAIADPEVRRQMLEDEDRFIERGSIRRYVVEVHETVYRPIAGA